LAKGALSSGHARALLSVTDEEAQEELFRLILDNGLIVREVETAAEHWKRTGRLPGAARNAVASGPSPRKARKTEKMKKIQVLLRERVHHSANISGDEEAGRIALSYASAGELKYLLRLLGIAPGPEEEEKEEEFPPAASAEVFPAGLPGASAGDVPADSGTDVGDTWESVGDASRTDAEDARESGGEEEPAEVGETLPPPAYNRLD
jgi:hypothetical protein